MKKKTNKESIKDFRKRTRFFFYNDELHKRMGEVVRGNDTIVTWNYPQKKIIRYSYTHILKNAEPAFTTSDICKMFNVELRTIIRRIDNGSVKYPSFSYSITDYINQGKLDTRKRYYYTEKDVLNIHQALVEEWSSEYTPRGQWKLKGLPSRTQLIAMLRYEEVLYVKVGDEYLPTWKAGRI